MSQTHAIAKLPTDSRGRFKKSHRGMSHRSRLRFQVGVMFILAALVAIGLSAMLAVLLDLTGP